MRKNSLAVIFLGICPLLVAQQPQPVPAAPADQQAAPAVAPASPAAQSIPAQPAPPDTLLDGTAVKLRISQTISSEEAKTGQEVPFEVLEDVSVNGVIVIKKGDSAFGTVTKAEPKRMMGRGGKLDMSISYVRLADQEKVPLRATKESKGHGSGVGMGVGIGVTAVLFFPAAPLFLLMKGKDVTVPQGTEVTAYVEGDMRLDLDKFRPAPPQAAAPGAPVAVQVSISIDSTPPGADIEIDGGFVGNTPSTVTVAPGSHQIAVKKKGFNDWVKTLNVTSGAVRLNAELEQAPPAQQQAPPAQQQAPPAQQ
jgi:hypothetical protein